jgi:putative acetyltransferase
MEYSIRCETEADERIVEEITRQAFWNIHVPGCNEHYLAHLLRKSKDFIHELDFVISLNDEVIGNIMYTKSYVTNTENKRIDTITFGPVSVLPKYQKQGFGAKLIMFSMQKAKELGYSAIIIFGNPHDYCKHGFFGSKKYRIGILDRKYPCALLVKPLVENAFSGGFWSFHESETFEINESEFLIFDETFGKMKKDYRYSQEEFTILSHSFVE